MAPVVLLTDFGLHDSYVGQVKGAILGVNERLPIVDLVHELPAYGIEIAAYILAYTYPVFPKGSVFVCVVDPGVGTKRRAIAVKTGGYYFVGPDNGIFSVVVSKSKEYVARELTDSSLWRKSISSTFHGRDVFGPTGAHIATDPAVFEKTGPALDKIAPLAHELPQVKERSIDGRIIHVDRFGNVLTNIESGYIPNAAAVIHLGKKRIGIIASTYGEIPAGQAAGVRNSFGLLEIAMRERHIAKASGVRCGEKVRVTWKK